MVANWGFADTGNKIREKRSEPLVLFFLQAGVFLELLPKNFVLSKSYFLFVLRSFLETESNGGTTSD